MEAGVEAEVVQEQEERKKKIKQSISPSPYQRKGQAKRGL